MGASSSLLLGNVPLDKRELASKRFSELVEAGKTEEEACAIVQTELQTEQQQLPQPPGDDVSAPASTNDEEGATSTAATDGLPPSAAVGEQVQVNKSKLSLIKKKVRSSSKKAMSDRAVSVEQVPSSASSGNSNKKLQLEKSTDNDENAVSDKLSAKPSEQQSISAPVEVITGKLASTKPPVYESAAEVSSGKAIHKDNEGLIVDGLQTTSEDTGGLIAAPVAVAVAVPAAAAAPAVETEVSEAVAAVDASSTSSSAAAGGSSGPVMSKDELMRRYGEVEFLLRTPLTCNADIESAAQAAAQGIAFIEKITHFSQTMGENRGMLLRWVLPFDATTSISDQSNVAGAGDFEGSGTGSAITAEQDARFRAVIDESAKSQLLAGALALRQLVRVKLSDESDLKQGIASVTDTNTFLVNLQRVAEQEGSTPFALLQNIIR